MPPETVTTNLPTLDVGVFDPWTDWRITQS